MQKGILLVVSGFAGSGKGTLMKELVNGYEGYALSVSATTRAPRNGETHGKEYFFVSKEEFEDMIENKELLEHACYVGNYYGTPKAYVEKMLDEGRDVILEIETQGALKIKELIPDSLLMFIMPPTVDEIYSRLKKRGTETEDVILSRMKRASEEVKEIEKYDYIIINDDIAEATKKIHSIVQDVKNEVKRNLDIVESMNRQFDKYRK